MSASQTCNNDFTVNQEEVYELAHQAIATAEEFCFESQDRITNIAGNFRMGNTEEACNEFGTLIDDLQLITELLNDLKILIDSGDKDLSAIKAEIEREEKNFFTTATELLEAQEKEDWILIADLLEFELNPFISSLDSTLKNTRNSI